MDYILLIVGFFILIKGADIMVDGASSFAKKMWISSLVIGLTVVAFGTSAPELFINSFSALRGETGLAIGNIVGSNIANILLILWVAAVIYPLQAKKSTIFKEVPFALLWWVALLVLIFDIIFSGSDKNILSFWDGIVLLLFFLIFFVYTFWISKNGEDSSVDEEVPVKDISKAKSILYIIWWITFLAVWADFLVKSATNIASSFGVSETFIGLTIVAIGTSLPELMTSAVASLKKNSDIAIWNVVGSNIFNTFLILWITSLIAPIEVENSVIMDVLTMIWVTFLLIIFLFFLWKRWIIHRGDGILFIILYIIYMAYLISTQVS